MPDGFIFDWRMDKSGLQKFRRQFPDKLDQFGRAVSTEIVGDIKLSFGTSPSAPGDPPGVDTGALRASIRWMPDGKLQWRVGDGVEYGADLEFGTSQMAARPWLTPVFMDWMIGKAATFAKAFPWEAGLG